MKKVGLSDTVLVEIVRKLRVARLKLCVFPGANIAGKKTKICRKFDSEDFLQNEDFLYNSLKYIIKTIGP